MRLFSGDDRHIYSKVWSHSAILVTGCCLDLDHAVSSKPKWLGTRSPNSMNAPASTFCTRLGGTGRIVENRSGGTGGIVEVWWPFARCCEYTDMIEIQTCGGEGRGQGVI